MRLLIQRVKEARVIVENSTVGHIKDGLLVFIGIHKEDTSDKIPWLAKKLVGLRIFNDEAGKMNKSVQEVAHDILIVSQFTLYGNCNEGRRPDFGPTAPASIAEPLYNQFVQTVSNLLNKKVETGIFGAHMDVHLINNGPVTFFLER